MKGYKYLYALILTLLIFVAGVICGHYFWSISKVVMGTQIREDSKDYKFINPLLLVTSTGIGKATEYKSITKDLSDYVNKIISQKKAEDVSIYFRDLNSGLYSGVNENHLYSPASMMKVAVLLIVLQKAEMDPGFLNKNIYVNPKSDDLNVGQFYPPKQPIQTGRTYTVNELIKSMIVDSDNNATYLLGYLIGDNKISDLLKQLQLPDITTSPNIDSISPQLYSRFYRVLYNSTYLSQNVSEAALKLLATKDFPQGLAGGLPENIDVAQKFGERSAFDQFGNAVERELHDCGIVYLPNNPYFLCVMTKGQDFTKLQPILTDVSSMVWDYYSKNNK